MTPQRPLGEEFLRAMRVAAELHEGQTRKGTPIPYVAHLLGTCAIALEHGADEDEAIAALLHDSLEDVRDRDVRSVVASFGPQVLRIVEACSDTTEHRKPPWRPRKEAYLARLRSEGRSVLLVAAADKLNNARSVLLDLHRMGDALWSRFSAGRDDQLWYYRSFVEVARTNPAHHPELVDEIERVTDEIATLAGSG